MDKARADVTDWYLNMVKRATAMTDYMSPNFLQKRISQIGIWKAPSAVVFETDQLNNTCKYVNLKCLNATYYNKISMINNLYEVLCNCL